MSAEFEKVVLEKLGNLEKTQQETLDKLWNFEKFTILKFESVEGEIKEIKEDVTVLKEDVAGLKEDVTELKEGLQVTKEAVILMEDKITREIPTLFDAYSMHQEIFERQEKEMNSINKKLQKHDVKIACLEQNVI